MNSTWLRQNSYCGKELKKFCLPNRRDDLCHPPSMGEGYRRLPQTLFPRLLQQIFRKTTTSKIALFCLNFFIITKRKCNLNTPCPCHSYLNYPTGHNHLFQSNIDPTVKQPLGESNSSKKLKAKNKNKLVFELHFWSAICHLKKKTFFQHNISSFLIYLKAIGRLYNVQ